MKNLLPLLSVVALFFASSLMGRAGTEMITPAAPSYNAQAAPGYWVAPPPPAPYYYPPVASYYGPPPYYYGYGPRYYGPAYGYYGPGVRVYAPGIFFGFGFHGRR
jgi:hypothetical protein